MKVRLLSDLHLEGFDFEYTFQQEDVLILAGDIHTKNRLEKFIKEVPETVNTYFVAGNHEYYGQDFEETNNYFIELQTKYRNFIFLNNDYAFLKDGTPIFGGTMFTDFTLDGISNAWFTKHAVKDTIADFYMIKTKGQHYEERNWTPFDHETQFKKFEVAFVPWLKATEGNRRVVVTHFMPTPQLTHERFKRSQLNPYFTQNMEEFMGWDGYWFCGHGHDTANIKVGDTKIIMNPKGYGKENKFGFNPNLILEI